MSVRIAFRADATTALGHGHLKRCLALALALREQDAEVSFAGRSDGAAVAMLAAQGVAWHELRAGHADDDDAAATLALLPWTPQIVVVDHYALDRRWHDAVRAASGAKIVVIDDLADRPLAPDLLVDHNPAADHATKYRAVLAPGVPICGGPRHALLDAVYARHAHAAWRPQVQEIGIFMGGSDPANHSAWVLRVLRDVVGWTGGLLRIASTSSHPRLSELRELAQAAGVELFLDLPHLAEFHATCDLQIGAGGGALWERCCLGVPTIALVCADNQRLSVPLAAQAGVLVGLDATGQTVAQADALAAAVRHLLADADARAALRKRSLALVDGQGAQRVAAAVLDLLRGEIQLRPATLDDAELLLAWRNDERTRAASHHGEIVALEDHRAWLARTLADPRRGLWVAGRGGRPVGTVRADRNEDPAETLLSWTVAPDQRGTGVGRLMVQAATRRLSGALHAEVKLGNEASARIAQAAGLSLHSQVGSTLHFRRPG